ncbi:MAG: glycosyl transferase family 2 [Candidatus Daviesbacteria bacterium GW2011_GWA1_38_7]|nr:MAG: glycosyl transferase family 2 [Candidatus Daviesbacteria bacterium GW2011_GWA1_38_7]
MLTREGLQEAQYKIFGPYHRRRLSLPFASSRLRYDVTLPLMPDNLNGLAVLDYGGGDGAMATLLADRGASVAVVDSSRAALRFAQSDARLKVVQAKTDLPIKSGSFDLVTLLETIEHIDDTSEIRALAETSRVLKPDGSAIISVPSSNRAVRMKHYRHYSYGDLIKKCAKQIEDAVAKAENIAKATKPEDMFKYMYAEMTPALKEQLEYVHENLGAKEE